MRTVAITVNKWNNEDLSQSFARITKPGLYLSPATTFEFQDLFEGALQ